MVTVDRTELTCAGLIGEVTIRRDRWGVAHIAAGNEMDAWFGQGFAAAHDRLWQMEYDRRRAMGRWAEAAGTAGLASRPDGTAAGYREGGAGGPHGHERWYTGDVRGLRSRGKRVTRQRCVASPGVRLDRHSPGALGGVALGRTLQDPARPDGAVAVEDGRRRAARAGRAGDLGEPPLPLAGRDVGHLAAGRRGECTLRTRERRDCRGSGTPGLPLGDRGGVEFLGRARLANDDGQAGGVQRLAPGARCPECVLAGPGGGPRLRCERSDIRRLPGVPALRLQRRSRMEHHAYAGGLPGPLPGEVRRCRGGALLVRGRLDGGEPPRGDRPGARFGPRGCRLLEDGARTGGAWRPAQRHGDRTEIHGPREVEAGVQRSAGNDSSERHSRAVRCAGDVGRSGEQPGGGRHRREYRLPGPR